MAQIIDFKNSINAFIKEFGAGGTLANQVPVQSRTATIQKPDFVSKAKKWVDHTAKSLKAREVTYEVIPHDLMRYCLARHLDFTGHDFVLNNFIYQTAQMQLASIVSDRVIEYAIVEDPEQYGKEFKKVCRMGKFTANKQSYLEQGKALANFFFFVCPDGLLSPADVPAHAGLIHAYIPSRKVLPVFSIVKAAPVLHIERLAPGTYKTIAKHLNEALQRSLLRRNCTFDSFPWDRNDHSAIPLF